MTVHYTPRMVAWACLVLAVTLLLLVGLVAPTKPTRDLSTPTPTPETTPVIPATPLALLLAGSPRPHPGWVVADYRKTPTPRGAP